MQEIWKDIPDYDGYQVSNLGRIKSFCKSKKGIILKQRVDKEGYAKVTVSKNNKNKEYLVHRLVAEAFIPNKTNFKSMPDEDITKIDLSKLQINHKDENKQNNVFSNLEWCTRKYNINYGTRNIRAGISCRKKVAKYDFNENLLDVYSSILEAKQKNSKSAGTHISEVCNGKRKSAYGFIWKYYNH